MRPSEARWRINRHPRFTALGLAEYMVADGAPRETILRNMRFENLRGTTLYSHLYRAIPRFLTSPTRDQSILDECRAKLKRELDAATSPKAHDNVRYVLRALDAFEGSLNALPIAGWNLTNAPLARPLKISNVSVSVQPTAHITIRRARGADLAGALLIDMTKGIALKTDRAQARATESMGVAAILLHQYATGEFPTKDPKASTEHCIVFHTYRQEMVHCPTNYRGQLRNIEAECGAIFRGWDRIDPPPGFDPSMAVYR